MGCSAGAGTQNGLLGDRQIRADGLPFTFSRARELVQATAGLEGASDFDFAGP